MTCDIKCLLLVRIIAKLWILSSIDEFNYRVQRYKNYHLNKTGIHFVGQKRNQINGVSLIIQYSNQLFENKEQLLNIDIEYLFIKSNFRAQSKYVLTIINCTKKSPDIVFQQGSIIIQVQPQYLFFWQWSLDTVMQCEETILKPLPLIDLSYLFALCNLLIT